VIMGALRRERSRKEISFLEMVSGQLVTMNSEINDLKQLVRSLMSCYHVPMMDPAGDDMAFDTKANEYIHLPPAPPPPLDTYNKAYLLAVRTELGKIKTAVDLPKTMLLERAHWNLEQAGDTESPAYRIDPRHLGNSVYGVQVDWDSACFELDEDDLNENMHESTQHAKQDIEVALGLTIIEAQHTARKSRFRENWATHRIQSFWRTCKQKLNRYYVSNDQAGSSHIDEVPSRNGVRRGAFSLASASNLAGKSSLTKFDILWQIELLNERNANDYWSREEANRTSGLKDFYTLMKHHVDTIAGRIKDDTLSRKDGANLLFHRAQILTERRGIPSEVFHAFAQELLSEMGVEREQINLSIGDDPHFCCETCGFCTSFNSRQCPICEGHDIFDNRECVCGYRGICGIGACRQGMETSVEYAEDAGYICTACDTTFERQVTKCLNCGLVDTVVPVLIPSDDSDVSDDYDDS